MKLKELEGKRRRTPRHWRRSGRQGRGRPRPLGHPRRAPWRALGAEGRRADP